MKNSNLSLTRFSSVSTVLLVIVLAFFVSLAIPNNTYAISGADKKKYNACVKAFKGKKLKQNKTYACPNDKGASIYYSKKSKDQKYIPASSNDSSTPGTTSNNPSTNPATDVNFDVPTSDCGNTGFFAFPTWYQYLECDDTGGISQQTQTGNLPVLIILAVIDILLVLAGFAAVIYGMYGGFKLIISKGQPDGIAKGRTTILNATIGLVIAILASQIVSFIASKLS